VISLAGVVAAPLTSAAQQVPRIGWLTNSVVHTANVEALREGMRALGYPEVRLELRAAAGQMDRLSALAAELLSLNVTSSLPTAVRRRLLRNRPLQPFPL
jgi:ubiquinone biosynthesis protein COQ9